MSGGGRAKVHHYIPKALQRYFCFEGEKIWFSERNSERKFDVPSARNINSTFQKKDYYTVLKDGKLSDVVEKIFYGKIDDFLGKFLKMAHSSFDRRLIPTLDDEGMALLSQVVFHMVKRNPEFSKAMNDKEIGAELSDDMLRAISDWENAEGLRAVFEKRKQDNLVLLKTGRDVRVRAQLQSSPEIDLELSTLKLRWAVSHGKHSFVLASSLVYKIGNGGPNGLKNPDFEMWLPISPKRAIVLVRDEGGRLPLVFPVDRDHMRKINTYGMTESNQIASQDKKLLMSLISNRM